ncbi:adhesion G-protein coupled receptor G6-like [Mya arenaria]|uniref:adhesion G-protein coupled receptor G6-like n=1 Tax=Mya arenaria TaxID=6604 RepID=UPI0022E3BCEB|nr:adhesion G-protein coupled receptor G6-like [Mya arenaria]
MYHSAYVDSKDFNELWVNQTNSTTPCAAYFRNLNFVESLRNCDESHLYICTKPTRFLGHTNFEIGGPFLDQDEFLEYSPLTLHTLYGKLDRAVYEGELVFVHTPTAITDYTSKYYEITLNDRDIVTQSNPKVAPYYINVTLPPWEINSFRLDLIYDNIMRSAGYYTFGLYNINPPQSYKPSPPVLVRYSAFENSGKLSMSMMHKFNLLKDENIPNIINAYTGGMYNASIVPAGLGAIASDYRGKIEYVSSRTLKMRIFVAPRDASTDLEQVVLQIVKKHLRTSARNIVNPDTLVVRSTVTCPLTVTHRDGRVITFQSVRIGDQTFSWERCYPENKALATAECKGNYDDGAILDNIRLADGCGVVPAYNQSTSTEFLKNLSETVFDKQNFKNILNTTVKLTDPRVNLTEADIIYVADILYHYLDFDIRNTSSEVMDYVLSIANNILQINPESIDLAQKITSAGNTIIRSVDDLTNQVQLSTNGSLQFIRDSIVSEIWDQNGSGDLVIGINLSNTTGTAINKDSISSVKRPDDVDIPTAETTVYLGENLVKGHVSRLTFHIYAKTDLFSTAGNRLKINSKVAAARLTKNGRDIVQLGNDSVTIVFQVLEDHNNPVCSYWDYYADEGAGGWRTDGCSMTSYVNNTVVCKCNHLTNFAVLIDLEGGSGISERNKVALGIITKVGLSISIIGLGLTILTFVIFKHLRNGRGRQVLVNLSVSILCSAILFLFGMERTESRGGCIVVAALLHYFILVSFMWMLVEGILQYLRFVKVLGTYIPKFMIKTMIPAWGIPLIPVIIVLAIDYDMYYGGKGYCWLSGNPLLYAFIIPIAVVILANLIVFTLVMCNLLRRNTNTMKSNQSELKMASLHFQAAVSIFVILGLSWVFGFLTVDDTRIVFHYLFAIFNAFQGLFIFLLFTLREKKIRNAWRKLCCPKSVYKSTTGSEEHTGKSTHSAT